jgi:hypothetical protein
VLEFAYVQIGWCKPRVLGCAFCAVGAVFVSMQSLAAQDTLQPILDRIHRHAAQADWKQAGWKDEAIEGWLDNLTSTFAKAAELPGLKLPVRFADVTPGVIAPDGAQQKSLLVGKNMNLGGATLYNSIVLADGNFVADTAQGCVIVARGVVELQKSEWSVIVAGVHLRIAGSDGQVVSSENGSLIATRGRASMQAAYGTVLFAGEGATISSSRNAVFVNAVIVGSSAERSRSVKMKNVPIEDLPVHDMAERIRMLGIIYPEAIDSDELRLPPFLPGAKSAPQLSGIVFQFDGRRYTAEVGQPILDEADQSAPALADWKVSYANNSLAIFSSDEADAVVRLGK